MSEQIPLINSESAQKDVLPPDYYQMVAKSEVNTSLHLAIRGVVAVARVAMYGRQKIVATEAFNERREELKSGNVISAAVHRDELDTVWLPSALERVGIHHSRPVAKQELFFINPALTWTLHKLGAFGVNRKDPDMEGLALVQSTVLGSGGNITNYAEGTRVHTDVKRVGKIGRGPVFAAAEHDSIIVPIGIAGLSSEKTGKKPNMKTVQKDKKSPLGFGPKLVYAFGDPLQFGSLPEVEMDEEGNRNRSDLVNLGVETKRRAKIIQDGMQDALDLAYKTRDQPTKK